jgi:hypothetical protein
MALTGKTKTLTFEKLRPLVTPECPFVNLPETHICRRSKIHFVR